MLIRPTCAALLGVALFASAPVALLASSVSLTPEAMGQASAPNAVPHQSGTVKMVEGNGFVLTTNAGQDVSVAVPAGVAVLVVQPGSRDLKSAQTGTVADIAAGDRTIVNGTAGDSGTSLNASRVIVMKSGAIAATRATEQTAWAQGVGGIVGTVDSATGTLTLANGMRTVTVNTTPATTVKRYAGGSVRFEDAVPSTLAAIHAGDQIRVRGAKNADGSVTTADAIVTGSFSNFSGLITAIDLAANTVILKDLATKRMVTVAVPPSSNIRRLPVAAAGGMVPGGVGPAGEHPAAEHPAGEHTVGERPARAPAANTAAPGAQPAAEQGVANRTGGGRPSGYTHAGTPGSDLSRMLSRLPQETLGTLKPGDAVMIVASNSGEGTQPTAITLLAGVEGILAAHPTGETTLSPWNLGGGEGAGDGGEGGSR